MNNVPLGATNGDGLLHAGGCGTGVQGPSGCGARCKVEATGADMLSARASLPWVALHGPATEALSAGPMCAIYQLLPKRNGCGLCAWCQSAVERFKNGPVALTETACVTVECVDHAASPQPAPTISVTNKWYRASSVFFIGRPPQDVTRGVTPYAPVGLVGPTASAEQEVPRHGGSQTQRPSWHTPSKLHSSSVLQARTVVTATSTTGNLAVGDQLCSIVLIVV